MGNCLPSLSPQSKRQYKNKSRSHGTGVPLDHGAAAHDQHGEPPAQAAAPAPCKREATPPMPCSKRSVRFAEEECNGGKNKDGVKVKVVMTKKEAALLLSMLAGGRERTVEDMLRELRSEANMCSNVISSTCKPVSPGGEYCWRPALESIPEI